MGAEPADHLGRFNRTGLGAPEAGRGRIDDAHATAVTFHQCGVRGTSGQRLERQSPGPREEVEDGGAHNRWAEDVEERLADLGRSGTG